MFMPIYANTSKPPLCSILSLCQSQHLPYVFTSHCHTQHCRAHVVRFMRRQPSTTLSNTRTWRWSKILQKEASRHNGRGHLGQWNRQGWDHDFWAGDRCAALVLASAPKSDWLPCWPFRSRSLCPRERRQDTFHRPRRCCLGSESCVDHGFEQTLVGCHWWLVLRRASFAKTPPCGGWDSTCQTQSCNQSPLASRVVEPSELRSCGKLGSQVDLSKS